MTQHTEAPPHEPATQPAATAAVPLWRRPLFWSLLLLLLLALVAAWTAWTQRQAAQARNAALTALAERQHANNTMYEAERDRLKAALADDPCKAKDALRVSPDLPDIVPDHAAGGEEGEPLRLPPAKGEQAGTPAKGEQDGEAPRTPPAQVPDETPKSAPDKKPEAREILTTADLVEQATVMILTQGSKGAGMGSGFFITPDLIFTNAHVAMEPSARVLVCNKATGSPLPGAVAAITTANGRDYALIRLSNKTGIRPLAIKEQARRTDRISAWGFPGAVTGGDPKFAALLAGDVTAAPEVVYTEGTISVVLERKPPLIVHSAVISQGNSGGPLVDENGTVIGVNTLIRLDGESYRQSSMAIAASDIIAFLKEQGVPFVPASAKPDAARPSGGKE